VAGSNRDSSLLSSMVMKGRVVGNCWFFEDVEVTFESLELANLCFAGALRMTECECPFTTKQFQIMTFCGCRGRHHKAEVELMAKTPPLAAAPRKSQTTIRARCNL
jgi:hypothetical protein